MIRLGDHKLMRHLLTGERRLYDVVKDPAEETNLIRSMRSKADQLDSVMKKYLEDIGAEDVGEVYQARLEELDLFEVRAKENFRKKTRDLDPKKDAAEVARLKAKLQADLERFARNRVEVDLNRNSSHWAARPEKQLRDRASRGPFRLPKASRQGKTSHRLEQPVQGRKHGFLAAT